MPFRPSNRLALTSVFVFAGLGFLAGCNRGGDDYTGPRGEVQGTVKFHGEPLPEGTVVVFQAAKGPTYLASGVVQSDGTFQLSYLGSRKLPAIEYGVRFSPPTSESNKQEPVDPENYDFKAVQEAAQANAPPLPFPSKYLSSETSKLTFTVEEGQNVAEFDLED